MKLLDNLAPEERGRDDDKLLSVNRLLSSKPFLIGLCVAVTVLVLVVGTVLANAVCHITEIIKGENINFLAPSGDYLPMYLILLAICAILCAVLIYKARTSFGELNVGQKGHSRFAAESEIKKRFLRIAEKNETFEGTGGLPEIRDGKHLYIQNNIQNNLVVAMTRAGKGETLVIPSIEIYSRASVKQSLVIIDVKGELANAAVENLLDRGYQIQILDFIAPEQSMHWNPLCIATKYWLAGDVMAAEQTCTTIAAALYEDPNTKDRFWVDSPKALFCAVALAHIIDCAQTAPQKINIPSVARFINVMAADQRDKGSALENFFDNRPITDRARMRYATIKFSGGSTKTLAGILSMMVSKLDIYSQAVTEQITCYNDIDLDAVSNPKQPCATFIRVPHFDRTYYPVATMFINQVYFYCEREAGKTNHGVLPRPIKVIGDEIFNAPPIDDIENKVSAALGSGFSFDFYAQSFEQMEKVYGKEVSGIIQDNCAAQFYLMSGMEETREKISKELGNYTAKNVSRMGERLSISKNITENYEERPLMSAAELKELEEGEQIVIHKLQRHDLEGNKIKPLPVFARGDHALTYRYQYLPEWNPQGHIPYNRLNIKKISLTDNLYYTQQDANEVQAMRRNAQAKANRSKAHEHRQVQAGQMMMQGQTHVPAANPPAETHSEMPEDPEMLSVEQAEDKLSRNKKRATTVISENVMMSINNALGRTLSEEATVRDVYYALERAMEDGTVTPSAYEQYVANMSYISPDIVNRTSQNEKGGSS